MSKKFKTIATRFEEADATRIEKKANDMGIGASTYVKAVMLEWKIYLPGKSS